MFVLCAGVFVKFAVAAWLVTASPPRAAGETGRVNSAAARALSALPLQGHKSGRDAVMSQLRIGQAGEVRAIARQVAAMLESLRETGRRAPAMPARRRRQAAGVKAGAATRCDDAPRQFVERSSREVHEICRAMLFARGESGRPLREPRRRPRSRSSSSSYNAAIAARPVERPWPGGRKKTAVRTGQVLARRGRTARVFAQPCVTTTSARTGSGSRATRMKRRVAPLGSHFTNNTSSPVMIGANLFPSPRLHSRPFQKNLARARRRAPGPAREAEHQRARGSGMR